jgi:hypothetical protein
MQGSQPGGNDASAGGADAGASSDSAPTTQAAPAEPIEKTIRLLLPPDREFGETIKLVVEVVRSDMADMRRVVNRTVKKSDFPYTVSFMIPINGESQIKVYYDNVLMAEQTYLANE